MGKLVAPDGHMVGVDVKTSRGTIEYKADKTGTMTVENPSHAKQLLKEGFINSNLMGATSGSKGGFDCANCGFGSWFAICSRCGADNG